MDLRIVRHPEVEPGTATITVAVEGRTAAITRADRVIDPPAMAVHTAMGFSSVRAEAVSFGRMEVKTIEDDPENPGTGNRRSR